MNVETLTKLFRGRDQLPEECGDLTAAIEQGWVAVTEETYRRVAEPPQSSPRCDVWIDARYGGGTEEHGELKWWAWNWLRRRGERDPVFEYDTCFGRADVAAPGISCVVECGDTPARKVLQAFWEGDWKTFVLFPYMYVEELAALHVRPKPRLYIFRLTEIGQRELPALFRRYTEGWQARIKKVNIFESIDPARRHPPG